MVDRRANDRSLVRRRKPVFPVLQTARRIASGWVSQRRTPHVWDKGERNRVLNHWLQIEFKPGQGNATGSGSDPSALLRWSSDGGFTWPGVRTLKLGKIGEYTRRAIARRLGAPRDRVYEVTVSDPVNRDVVGATIKAEGAYN